MPVSLAPAKSQKVSQVCTQFEIIVMSLLVRDTLVPPGGGFDWLPPAPLEATLTTPPPPPPPPPPPVEADVDDTDPGAVLAGGGGTSGGAEAREEAEKGGGGVVSDLVFGMLKI